MGQQPAAGVREDFQAQGRVVDRLVFPLRRWQALGLSDPQGSRALAGLPGVRRELGK